MPIVVHTVTVDGEPVAPPSFIAAQLERANQIYRPLGFELVAQPGRALPARHAEVVTRAQRDAFARYVRRGAIHCFVVAKLMDVDEPGRERRGVHWHARRSAGVRYIVLSRISGPFVLAHELGHYLGNPRHSDVAGNLMSYIPGEGVPVLDAPQIARVQATLARMIEAGEIVPR